MDGFAGYTITTTPLEGGDAGVRRTVANMQRLVDEGSRNPEVREAVIRAIHQSTLAPHDFVSQVEAWFRFVRDRVRFVHDPTSSEWLQTPHYTLRVMAGDCDDRAMLLAAGLRSIGVPAEFKVVAANPLRPRSFSHVYVVANMGGRKVALDPTYPNNRLGSEPRRISRTWMVPAWLTG